MAEVTADHVLELARRVQDDRAHLARLLAQVAGLVDHEHADGSALVHLPAGLLAAIRRHARP